MNGGVKARGANGHALVNGYHRWMGKYLVEGRGKINRYHIGEALLNSYHKNLRVRL